MFEAKTTALNIRMTENIICIEILIDVVLVLNEYWLVRVICFTSLHFGALYILKAKNLFYSTKIMLRFKSRSKIRF